MSPRPSARRVDRFLAGAADLALRGYQVVLSPLKGVFFGQAASCRFHPTCSEYARQCFAVHPFPRAAYLALRRLLRCHPLHAGGYDPVPGGARDASPAGGGTGGS